MPPILDCKYIHLLEERDTEPLTEGGLSGVGYLRRKISYFLYHLPKFIKIVYIWGAFTNLELCTLHCDLKLVLVANNVYNDCR